MFRLYLGVLLFCGLIYCANEKCELLEELWEHRQNIEWKSCEGKELLYLDGKLMAENRDCFHSQKLIGKPNKALLLMMLFTAFVL